MTKAEVVFRGFVELTETEQKEVIAKISDYLKKDKIEKGSIKTAMDKSLRVDPGPIGGGTCPCCGR